MRHQHALCLSITTLTLGCTTKIQRVPVTEIVLQIESDASVRAAMSSLRVRTSVQDKSTAAWVARDDASYDLSDLSSWPVILDLVPANASDATLDFQVIVEAVDADGTPLVQSRAISHFIAQEQHVLGVTLAPCGNHPLSQLCQVDDCDGLDCLTCSADQTECVNTTRVDASMLPTADTITRTNDTTLQANDASSTTDARRPKPADASVGKNDANLVPAPSDNDASMNMEPDAQIDTRASTPDANVAVTDASMSVPPDASTSCTKNACGTCGPVPAEVCDGVDNNCNGMTDEGCQFYYKDCDGDGYAVSTTGRVFAMSAPVSITDCLNWTTKQPVDDSTTDCDDTRKMRYPGAPAGLPIANQGEALPPQGDPAWDLNCDGMAVATEPLNNGQVFNGKPVSLWCSTQIDACVQVVPCITSWHFSGIPSCGINYMADYVCGGSGPAYYSCE